MQFLLRSLAAVGCLAIVSGVYAGVESTRRVSVGLPGYVESLPSGEAIMSRTGLHVAFVSTAPFGGVFPNGVPQPYVYDQGLGRIFRIPFGSNNKLTQPSDQISTSPNSAGHVVFRSLDSTIVPNDTNGVADVFYHNFYAHTSQRVSVDPDGVQANGASGFPSISSDGRYVVFETDATNLVPGDTNGVTDIILADLQTGGRQRISVATDGTQANGASTKPWITADGNYVVYQSLASNLVSGDTNGQSDIFLYTISTGETRRISVSAAGLQGNGPSTDPSISETGRYVSYTTASSNIVTPDTNTVADIIWVDTTTGEVKRASQELGGPQANRACGNSFISPDGQYVQFSTRATTLVSNPLQVRKCIRYSVATGRLAAVSTNTTNDAQTAGISANGRHCAFTSEQNDLVPDDQNGVSDVFVLDTLTGIVTLCSRSHGTYQAQAPCTQPAQTPDASHVTFSSSATNLLDNNGPYQSVFHHDFGTATFWMMPWGLSGAKPNGASQYSRISDDGSKIVFQSAADNLVSGTAPGVSGIYLVTDNKAMYHVSYGAGGVAANGHSRWPDISPEGSAVVFESDASNLVAGDTNGVTDIFLAKQGVTTRVSKTHNGLQTYAPSRRPAVCSNGDWVYFESDAVLTPNDTNQHTDIYRVSPDSGLVQLVSVTPFGFAGNGHSTGVAIDDSGRYAAFRSEANNLTPDDTDNQPDYFVRDMDTGVTVCVHVATGGRQTSQPCGEMIQLSADGRYASFISPASDLVANDTNGAADVFIHDIKTGRTTRVSEAVGGGQADSACLDCTGLSNNGYIAYSSTASTLIPFDTNGYADVFQSKVAWEPTCAVNLGIARPGWLGPLAGLPVDIKWRRTGTSQWTTLRRYTAGDGTIYVNDFNRAPIDLIVIPKSHWLAVAVNNLSLDTSSVMVNLNLINGDADRDNQITIFDYLVLDGKFGTTDAAADIDGDGTVNLFDYLIIDATFGAQGAPY